MTKTNEMSKMEQFNLLKEKSIKAYDGMKCFWPQFKKEETIYISHLLPKFPGCFAMNNSTVSFIMNNEFFVTRYSHSVISLLTSLNFKNESFNVPLVIGNIP